MSSRPARLCVLLLFPLFASSASAEPPTPEDLFRAALVAHESSSWQEYRSLVERLVTLVPDPARLQLRLAGARARTGDSAGAFEALESQLLAGLYRRDLESDPDLASLREHARWLPLVEAHRRLLEPLVASQELFHLDRGDRLLEGVAHDPASGDFFLSSVRDRTVLRRRPDGALSAFALPGSGLAAAPLALAVDAPRRLLWVVSAGLSQAVDPSSQLRDRSELLAFDLQSGELRHRIAAGEGRHLWNDLALAGDGSVYVSDPGAAAIVRIDAQGGSTPVAPRPDWRSPGGLALSADQRLLYVADWSRGLAVVDLATNRASWMVPPRGATLLGIDGLVNAGGSLLAIQNGVEPARIVRLELAPDGRSLTGSRLLERAVPDWVEPTLGVLVEGALVYVGSSQWPLFGEDGTAIDPGRLHPPALRRLPLEADGTPPLRP